MNGTGEASAPPLLWTKGFAGLEVSMDVHGEQLHIQR